MFEKVLFLAGGLTEREEGDLVERIERSAVRFDHSSRGELSVREWYNVIKIQNKVDISLERVSSVKLLDEDALIGGEAK